MCNSRLTFGTHSPILLTGFSVWEPGPRSSEGDQEGQGQNQKFQVNPRRWKNRIPVAGERVSGPRPAFGDRSGILVLSFGRSQARNS